VAASDGGDPGWGSPGRILLGAVLPALAIRRAGGDGLVMLRSVFLSFAFALVAVGVVAVLITSGEGGDGDLSGTTAALGVGAIGLAAVTASQVVARRLDCTSEQALGESYRTRFFLRMALSESAALLGFVAVVVTDEPLPYGVGLAFAAVGFALAAPTNGRLQADQEVLHTNGCAHDLVSAIRSTPPRRA
jgi:F0F1-type ATP synthase membrane subunit c/vacuolar-type H+-ATPase subunit K